MWRPRICTQKDTFGSFWQCMWFYDGFQCRSGATGFCRFSSGAANSRAATSVTPFFRLGIAGFACGWNLCRECTADKNREGEGHARLSNRQDKKQKLWNWNHGARLDLRAGLAHIVATVEIRVKTYCVGFYFSSMWNCKQRKRASHQNFFAIWSKTTWTPSNIRQTWLEGYVVWFGQAQDWIGQPTVWGSHCHRFGMRQAWVMGSGWKPKEQFVLGHKLCTKVHTSNRNLLDWLS